VIAVGGSWGTLTEVAYAARRGDIPLVCLNGWRIVHSDGTPVNGITHVSSAAEAVAASVPGD
jgi:hypothetical protein